MRDELASGWKVSQVEALIDLPRRDIQRACYEGPGGIGIVRPQNTSWGWRVYEVADVAKLFLLAQARRRSQTLEEACREFTPSEDKTDLASALELCEQRARDARDTEAGALMAARALKCALAHEDQSIFAGLIDSAFGESARRTCDDHVALKLASRGLLSDMLEGSCRHSQGGQTSELKRSATYMHNSIRRMCPSMRANPTRCMRAAFPDDKRPRCSAYLRAMARPRDALVCECVARSNANRNGRKRVWQTRRITRKDR